MTSKKENKEKKKYVAPVMSVLEYAGGLNLLSGSSEDVDVEEEVYNGEFG